METYIVINRHEPEECSVLYEAIQASPWAKRLDGTTFLCTCPSGEHGATFAVEASSSEEALNLVDAEFRGRSRALLGHLYTIGSAELPVG